MLDRVSSRASPSTSLCTWAAWGRCGMSATFSASTPASRVASAASKSTIVTTTSGRSATAVTSSEAET